MARFDDNQGSIIAQMRDCEHQKQYAELFAAAPELLAALRDLWAHLDDMQKSNPGYLGKLVLQDYGLWIESYCKTERVLAKLASKGIKP